MNSEACGREMSSKRVSLHSSHVISATAGSNSVKHLNGGGEFQIGAFGDSYAGVDTALPQNESR